MVLIPKQSQNGIFVNPDAIDAKTKSILAKLLDDVLKVTDSKVTVLDLLIDNPLTPEQGTIGRLYNYGRLVASHKPDGVPTKIQKVLAGDITYELEEYEVKVAITDKAKINNQMSAQNILNVGNAGAAFARRMDAEGYNEAQTGNVTTNAIPGGEEWSAGGGTDDQVMGHIEGCKQRLAQAGFSPSVAVMTHLARNRLATIGRGIGAGLSFTTFMREHLEIQNWKIVENISIINPDGSVNNLFVPFDYFELLDPEAWGVYSQMPTTLEFHRDVDAGVDFAYMRKRWKIAGIQPDACQVLSNTDV